MGESGRVFHFLPFKMETGSHYLAQAGLELNVFQASLELVAILPSSLLRVGITGVSPMTNRGLTS